MHQRLVLTQHMRRRRDGAQVQGFAGVPCPSRLRLPGRQNVRRRPFAPKPLSQHMGVSMKGSITYDAWDGKGMQHLPIDAGRQAEGSAARAKAFR